MSGWAHSTPICFPPSEFMIYAFEIMWLTHTKSKTLDTKSVGLFVLFVFSPFMFAKQNMMIAETAMVAFWWVEARELQRQNLLLDLVWNIAIRVSKKPTQEKDALFLSKECKLPYHLKLLIFVNLSNFKLPIRKSTLKPCVVSLQYRQYNPNTRTCHRKSLQILVPNETVL